jgi:hypothetical protein
MADVGTILQAQPTAAQEIMIFGMPMTYFIILIVLIFIIFMILVMFVWYWIKMGPCRAYFGAVTFGGSGELGLLCRQSGRASFIGTKYVTGIFQQIGIPLSWIQRSWESYRFGASSMKILCDMTGIATEPAAQQAIKEFVITHNDRELRREKKAEELEKVYRPQLITDYEDLYQFIVEGKDLNGNAVEIPSDIRIHAVFEVPIQSVQRFLAHIGAGDLEGHIATRIAEEMEEKKDESKLPGWFWIAVAIEVVIMVVFIITNYFSGQKKS